MPTTGTTQGKPSVYSGCTGGPAGDVAYSLVVAAGATVNVRVVPSGFDTVVSVATSAVQCGVSCLSTSDSAGFNGAETVTITNPGAAATYFIIVDGFGALDTGPFSITTTQLLADGGVYPYPGDFCDTAPTIPVTGGIGSIQSTTIGTINNDSSWCGGGQGADRAFAFTTNGGNVTLSATSSTPGFQPVLSLRQRCGGQVIGCGQNAGSSALLTTYLPSGTYVVTVDALTATSGDFLLSVSWVESACNTTTSCTTPMPLVLHDDRGWAAGCLNSVSDSSFCSPSAGGENVYRVDVPRPSHLVVSTGPQTNFNSLSTRISSVPCAAAPVSQCGFASTTNGTAENILPVDAGTWYVTVDSPFSSVTYSDYELLVQAVTPAPNATCETGTVLPLNGTIVGSTEGGRYSTSQCGGGRQTFYTLDLPGVASGSVVARPVDGGASLALSMLVNGCQSDAGLTCTLPNARAAFTGLPSGRHTFMVRSTDPFRTVTDFALDVSVDAGLGRGTCASPVLLPGNGMSTFTGSSDFFGSNLVGAGNCSTSTGPEVVFGFTTTTTHVFAASVTNSSGINPRMYLRTNCGSTVNETCGFNTLNLTSLAPGTYFLVVDGSGPTSGPFTLTVLLN